MYILCNEKMFGLRYDKNKIAAFMISFMLSYSAIINAINAICSYVFFQGFVWDTAILIAIYWGMLLFTLFKVIDRYAKLDELVMLALYVVSFVLTMAFFPDNIKFALGKDALNKIISFIAYAFAGYFICRKLDDLSVFIHIFEKFSTFSIILAAVHYFIGMLSPLYEPQYMVFSYGILAHVCLTIMLCINSFKWRRFILSIVGILLVCIAGSRGALLTLVVIIILFELISDRKMTKLKLISILVCSVFLAFFILNFDSIISSLILFLDKFDLKSRTLLRIQQGRFFESKERMKIQSFGLQALQLWGHGLYGDRIKMGTYAHNIFLELLYDFGFAGIILSLTYVILIIRAIILADTKEKIILLSMLSTGAFKLILSGSFLNQEPALYILLGISVDIIKKDKGKVRLKI